MIVGAGASFDAASDWRRAEVVRPPLVRELFDTRFDPILRLYPLAQAAAPEIRDILGQDDGAAVSLETYLRDQYRDSHDPYDRRRFHEVTLYLQDLLWQASRSNEIHFDNTDRMVSALVRHHPHVCFVTLNYDLILDKALEKLDPIEGMDGYIEHERWSLIKLHGSVDWGYLALSEVSLDSPPADLADHLDKRIHRAEHALRLSPPVREGPPRNIRRPIGSDQPRLFPALAVPVGEDDDMVCPDPHQEFLDRRLVEERELDLLIVGYSAYDRTVIEHLAKSERRVRRLTVVNAGAAQAEAVVARLEELMPQSLNGTEIRVADEAFGKWCRNSLDEFVEDTSFIPAGNGR